MSNDPMSSSEESDVFLDYMLRSALTAPGAATSPTAGRILARLLVVIAIEGGADLITPYLVPEPGEPATFEVRAYQPGNLTPTNVQSDLDAVTALRTAIRVAREGDAGVEVLSQSPSGLERCVVVRDSTGEFEFRFAGGETLTGDPDACMAARRSWTATLAEWRSWVQGSRPALESAAGPRSVAASEPPRALAPGGPEVVEPAPEAVGPASDAVVAPEAVEPSSEADRYWRPEPTAPEGVPAVTAGEDEAGTPAAREDVGGRQAHIPPAPERPVPTGGRPKRGLFRTWVRPAPAPPGAPEPAQPWAALRDHPVSPASRPVPAGGEEDPADAWRDRSRDETRDEPAVEPAGERNEARVDAAPPPVDAPPAEAAAAEAAAAEAAPAEAAAARTPPEPPATPVPAPAPALDIDELLAAIHEGFAGLSLDVDLTEMEAAILRALDYDRRGLVEPLARRLAMVVNESTERPDPQAMVDSLVPLLPRPGDIAEVVTARIADLLSETVLRRGQGETAAAPMVAGMMAAVDRFEVQIDGLHDQLRRATGVLESFGDRLQANDRRAAVAERTASILEQDMKRLIRQVDEQVAAISGSSDGGSELTDGVARLTRKMRQSVAQLDRILARLDIVLDAAGAPEEPGNDLLEAGDQETAGPRSGAGYDVPR